mgnify:CR=1 FL=1
MRHERKVLLLAVCLLGFYGGCVDDKCHWCEKEIDASGKFVFIEGFTFCDEKCESSYYSDRRERYKLNKPSLTYERMTSPTLSCCYVS